MAKNKLDNGEINHVCTPESSEKMMETLDQAEKSNNKKSGNNNADDFNLSDIEDEENKRKLLELDLKINCETLTRGERRKLQNQRNVLRAKIKKMFQQED